MVWRSLDRRVLRDRLLRDAGRHVDAELQALAVHVISDRRDATLSVGTGGELRGVGEPPAVLVDGRPLAARAHVVEVVDVDVLVADAL